VIDKNDISHHIHRQQCVRVTMRRGNHLGTSFEIWNGRHAWFWFVTDAGWSAAIGAAANEAEAICEARQSIEEMAARRAGAAEAPGISQACVSATRKCDQANSTDLGWNDLLANLDRYLNRLRRECVLT
jgi:hypothetical protein